MINNITLVGRLTRDPELMKTQSNISYVRFTLAVNRNFTNQEGETDADFISCIAWRGQAENLARFMNKGALIGVTGRIETGSYETEEGRRYTTDVIANNIQFLESKKDREEDNSGYYEHPPHQDETKQTQQNDDDLPF